MSALSRRLLRTTKTVSNGLPQQLWRFVASSSWALSNANTVALLNSGATATWMALNSTANARSSSTGKYYFEINTTKLNTGDAQALRVGIISGSMKYLFMPRGTKVGGTDAQGEATLRSYMEVGTGGASVYKWGAGDVIGCSIEPSGSNSLIRFYINGVDAGLDGIYAYSVANTVSFIPFVVGYRNTSTREIEIEIKDLKYLPAGFEPW